MNTERIPWWEALQSGVPITWPGIDDRRPIVSVEREKNGLHLRSAPNSSGDRFRLDTTCAIDCPDGTVEVVGGTDPATSGPVADAIAAVQGYPDGRIHDREAEAAIAAYREALGCGDDDVLVVLPRYYVVPRASNRSDLANETLRSACRAALEREGGA